MPVLFVSSCTGFVFVFASQGKYTDLSGSTYNGDWFDDKKDGKVSVIQMRQKTAWVGGELGLLFCM